MYSIFFLLAAFLAFFMWIERDVLIERLPKKNRVVVNIFNRMLEVSIILAIIALLI